jgi:hypothetical protein
MHPPEHPALPSEPLKEEQQLIVASTEAPAALPYAPSVAAAAAAAETARIESTAAADIPPVAAPTHEALMREASSAPGAMMRMEEEEAAAVGRVEEPRGGEKRKVEEAQGPLEGLVQLEEPPHKRQKKADEGAAAAGETPVVEMAGGEEAAGKLRPESAATPSGAETGGPSAMQVTQRTYDLKVLERKEHGPRYSSSLLLLRGRSFQCVC